MSPSSPTADDREDEIEDLLLELVCAEAPVDQAAVDLAIKTQEQLASLGNRQFETKRQLLKHYKMAMQTLRYLAQSAQGQMPFAGAFSRSTIADIRRGMKLDGG